MGVEQHQSRPKLKTVRMAPRSVLHQLLWQASVRSAGESDFVEMRRSSIALNPITFGPDRRVAVGYTDNLKFSGPIGSILFRDGTSKHDQ